MEIHFITDSQGNKKAAIVPFDEWERMEKAKEFFEHVYLYGIVKKRRSKTAVANLDDLLKGEGLTRADLES
jgi:hypothetical protein